MTLGEDLTTHTELAAKAKSLVPLIDRYAEYGDDEGQLAPEVVEAFHRDGMFKMWIPKELGGYELNPTDSLEVLEITSYADPSAGWVQMATCLATGVAGSYLGQSAVDELFKDGTYPVIGGQGTRPGTAVETEGGQPPQRIVELRLGLEARQLHPHVGHRRGHR